MTPDETRTALATMAVYWPHSKPEATTIALWQQKLPNMRSAALVTEALASLMESTPYWPHWSEFITAYRAAMAAERRDSQAQPAEALPAAPVPDRSTNTFTALRAALTRQPAPTSHQATELLGELVDVWGMFDDFDKWARKFGRMDRDCLTATVGDAVLWPESRGWTPFAERYLAHSDVQSLALWEQHTAAKAAA